MALELMVGIVAVALVLLVGLAVLLAKLYRQVEQGKVLIVNTMKAEPTVTFTGAVVIPIIHKAEVMDLSLKTIEIDRRGKEGLICQDNIRADIKVSFFVRVNKSREDVLKVAQSVGCARASDETTLQELFVAKFSEALKTVGKRLDFEDLYKARDSFKDQIIQCIGKDLNGYMLEDVAIDYIEQTPLDLLDPHNILDAEGIRKITERTAESNVRTNEFRQNERKQITKQNVEADETVYALERQRAEAAAKQQREIAVVQAREQSVTQQTQAEEALKSSFAKVKAEEELAVTDQARLRQVEVAQKNRERVVGIEAERVQKDRNLEAIAREREVELQRIGKEKALELERKAIADVISTRIAVDKKVATEEELIKDLRVTAEARRRKDAAVIDAEALAQAKVVHDVKAAEAQEVVSRHEAKRQLTLAEAALETADKQAKAKTRLAEGIQAEEAAHGLAQVRVQEADAVAIEKRGLAQAVVIREQGAAEAQKLEQKMLAEARGMAAQAEAQEKQGQAKANVTREQGTAEAQTLEQKMLAEARGLASKAESMKVLDDATREHEEFRLRLDKERAVDLETLNMRRHVAAEQAKVMGEAFKSAKVNIVGGDGHFFEQFMRAVSLGQSVDGAVDQSDVLKKLFAEYLQGNASLPADLKGDPLAPRPHRRGTERGRHGAAGEARCGSLQRWRSLSGRGWLAGRRQGRELTGRGERHGPGRLHGSDGGWELPSAPHPPL